MFNRFNRLSIGCGIILGVCAACGCHQIPNQQSYWGNGGEYQMEDEMIRRQWQKAAVGSESDQDVHPSVTQSKSRFESFKQFFSKSNSRSRLPETLNDDERFYPLDQISADLIVPKHSASTEVAQSADPLYRGKIVSIKNADSNPQKTEESEGVAMSGNRTDKNTANKDEAAKTDSSEVAQAAAEPKPSGVSAEPIAVQSAAAESTAAESIAAKSAAPSTAAPISAELSDCLDGISLCKWDGPSESLASPVPFFEQAAQPGQGTVSETAPGNAAGTVLGAVPSGEGQTPVQSPAGKQQAAREMILASPLAFLAGPSASPSAQTVSAQTAAAQTVSAQTVPGQTAEAPLQAASAPKEAVPAGNAQSLDPLQFSFSVPTNTPAGSPVNSNSAGNSLSLQPVNSAATVQPVHFETPASQIPAAPVSAVPNELHSVTETASGAVDWKAEVRKAVDSLKKEIQRQSSEGTISPAETARLQLLLLATGDSFDTVDSIVTESPALAGFWEKQCKGLRPLLEEANPDNLTLATEELAASLETLKTNCPVIIKKSLLTEAPASFGRYRVHSTAYQPKDTAHVYVELDNIITKKQGDQYGISVLCRWEIFNAGGKLAARPLEQTCSSQSASPMKDIVLNIPAVIPATLPAGQYRLHITVQDQNAAKIAKAESNLNLDIR